LTEGLPAVSIVAPEDALAGLLSEAQLVVLSHPVAAQAAFAALVAEGRRAAATPEGKARREQLAQSGLTRRLREAFELGSFNALEPDAEAIVPTDYVELLLACLKGGILLQRGR
jgi:hypothetical protein